MSFNKLYKELEETGLMSRKLALGKEADDELTELEEASRPKRHERKVKRMCLYCGERSEEGNFVYIHQCKTPTVVEEKDWPCPSRPIEVKFFEIIYNSKTYKFLDYHSAMRFRKLVWLDGVPLCNAVEDKYLRWYK